MVRWGIDLSAVEFFLLMHLSFIASLVRVVMRVKQTCDVDHRASASYLFVGVFRVVPVSMNTAFGVSQFKVEHNGIEVCGVGKSRCTL